MTLELTLAHKEWSILDVRQFNQLYLAAVDGPKHCQQQEREDDVNADLQSKAELLVQVDDWLENFKLNKDEANCKAERDDEAHEDDEGVEKTSKTCSCSCRRQKPKLYFISPSKKKVLHLQEATKSSPPSENSGKIFEQKN